MRVGHPMVLLAISGLNQGRYRFFVALEIYTLKCRAWAGLGALSILDYVLVNLAKSSHFAILGL